MANKKTTNRIVTIRTMERKGKYVIVADVVDENGKWIYTVPVSGERIYEDRAAALARAKELDEARSRENK